MNYGIIFEGDTSPLVTEVSDALRELGYFAYSDNTMSRELIDSLNTYRRANSLVELDFCDPVTLRTLGIDAGGDELMTLARCAAAISETEIECYDICAEIVAESRKLGITLTEAALRRTSAVDAEKYLPPFAVSAAVLAVINE